MSTEQMANERWAALSAIAEAWCTSQQVEVRDELSRARVEIDSLREQLRLANERADAAEIKSAHLQKRLEVAHESIAFANDKMAEQVRQARWEVADDALAIGGTGRETFLRGVRDANAPKD